MYAIINCCDRFHIFVYHTVLTYQKLWKDNDFIFRIPFNEVYPDFIKKEFGEKVQIIKTKKPFYDTIIGLTSDLDDNDFVLWCSSDTYIHEIADLKNLKILHEYTNNCTDNYNIGGLISTRSKGINIDKNKKQIKFKNLDIFYKTKAKNHKHIQFWLHQFLNV